jgi:hypothetical protein
MGNTLWNSKFDSSTRRDVANAFTLYSDFLRETAEFKMTPEEMRQQIIYMNPTIDIPVNSNLPLLQRFVRVIYLLHPTKWGKNDTINMDSSEELDWFVDECLNQVEFAVKTVPIIDSTEYRQLEGAFLMFISLIKRNPNSRVIPSLHADIIWHAFMIYYPENYIQYCMKIFKKTIPHNTDLPENPDQMKNYIRMKLPNQSTNKQGGAGADNAVHCSGCAGDDNAAHCSGCAGDDNYQGNNIQQHSGSSKCSGCSSGGD